MSGEETTDGGGSDREKRCPPLDYNAIQHHKGNINLKDRKSEGHEAQERLAKERLRYEQEQEQKSLYAQEQELRNHKAFQGQEQELRDLERHKAFLAEQQLLLQRKLEVADLVQQNQALVDKLLVAELAPSPIPAKPARSGRAAGPRHELGARPPTNPEENVTLDRLRQYEDLNNEVQQKLRTVKGAASYFTSDSSDSDESSCSGSSRRRKARGKHHKLKSGRETKAFNSVKNQLVWPHTQLRFQYLNNKTRYDKLDLALLTAGETQHLLVNRVSHEETVGRLHLLQRVAYHSKAYTWVACLNFHGAVLLDIERGLRSWSDTDFQALEASCLYQNPISKAPSKSNPSSKSVPKLEPRDTYFCSDYNRGQCSRAGGHDAMVLGRQRKVLHICARCWIEDKAKKDHPETAPTCPQRKP